LKPVRLMYSLTKRKGIRIGFALALVAMAAFCVFQAYLLAYLNTSAFASVPRTAGHLPNRADAYAWAGSLLDVGAALVLVPVFPIETGRGTAFHCHPSRNEVPRGNRYIYFWHSGVFAYSDVDIQDSPGWIISQPIPLTLLAGPPFWAQTAHPVHYLSDRDLVFAGFSLRGLNIVAPLDPEFF
jgi:hypothetical protein